MPIFIMVLHVFTDPKIIHVSIDQKTILYTLEFTGYPQDFRFQIPCIFQVFQSNIQNFPDIFRLLDDSQTRQKLFLCLA